MSDAELVREVGSGFLLHRKCDFQQDDRLLHSDTPILDHLLRQTPLNLLKFIP